MAEAADEGGQRREQLQQFVDEWVLLARNFVNTSSALAKQFIGNEPGKPRADGSGPFQDLWMGMASSAGDMAELSYKWVQIVDGLSGYVSQPPSEPVGDESNRSSSTEPVRRPAAASKPAGREVRDSTREDHGHRTHATNDSLSGDIDPHSEGGIGSG